MTLGLAQAEICTPHDPPFPAPAKFQLTIELAYIPGQFEKRAPIHPQIYLHFCWTFVGSKWSKFGRTCAVPWCRASLRLARCHDHIVDLETLSWRLLQIGPLSMSFFFWRQLMWMIMDIYIYTYRDINYCTAMDIYGIAHGSPNNPDDGEWVLGHYSSTRDATSWHPKSRVAQILSYFKSLECVIIRTSLGKSC